MRWKMRLFGTINLLQLQGSLYSINRGMYEAGVKYIKYLTTADGNVMNLIVF